MAIENVPIADGDFPASHVSLPEGMIFWSQGFLEKKLHEVSWIGFFEFWDCHLNLPQYDVVDVIFHW